MMRRLRAWGVALTLVGVTTLPAARAEPVTARTSTPTGYAGPARTVTQHPSRSGVTARFTSRNWAGYDTYAANHKTDFDFVRATWIEPKVKCNADTAWTVFWVGLDGWWNGTVEQGGTSAFCATKGGAAQHQLWWEMYPTNPIQIVLDINEGDKVTASVTYKKSTKVFTIKVKDVTTNKGFTRNERCGSGLTCDRSSAEVVTEDVGMFGAGKYFPLANYGTMGYTGIGATDTAGHTGSLSDNHWLHAAITERADGVTYATVSPPAHHGTAFTVTWKHK